MTSERAYGIDLGTTRSCIAYIDDHGESRVVKNAEGSRTTPSVVYFPRVLSLHDNDLTGAIPRELGGLASLKELSLRNNNLSGSIPPKLASLKKLAVNIDHRNRYPPDRDALMALYRSAGGLGWGKNVNWGTDAPLGDWSGVRVDDGGRVTELKFGHRLPGPIPPELGRLASLEELSLGNNRLTGTIPRELGGLAGFWGLEGNDLTGWRWRLLRARESRARRRRRK